MAVLIVIEPQTEPQKQAAACGRQPHVVHQSQLRYSLLTETSNVIVLPKE